MKDNEKDKIAKLRKRNRMETKKEMRKRESFGLKIKLKRSHSSKLMNIRREEREGIKAREKTNEE